MHYIGQVEGVLVHGHFLVEVWGLRGLILPNTVGRPQTAAVSKAQSSGWGLKEVGRLR